MRRNKVGALIRSCGPLGPLLVGSFLASCAPSAPPQEPESGAMAQSPNPDSPTTDELTTGLEEARPADTLYTRAAAVPEAPSHCSSAGPLAESRSCVEAKSALAEALRLAPAESDLALARLESCSDFAPGVLRALRAELSPAECADGLVEAVVGEQAPQQPTVSQELRETLVALGLGARLRRLAVDPPAAPESREKEALQAYFRDALFPWIERQASAIYSMASQGKQLRGYAKGIVAIESGNADMRFVEIARAAPIPREIESVPEARDVYYATLDESLEPRKARGTAAALVGLRAMAHEGVLQNERVELARQLLSRAYGGRRIDALDLLLLPELPELPAQSPEEVIASVVPTPYARALIGTKEPSPTLLRAHLRRGLPPALRRQTEAFSDPSASLLLLLARGLFERGRTYFRVEDFQDATRWTTRALEPREPPGPGEEADEARERKPSTPELPWTQEQVAHAALLRATSTALVAGPKDAAELIARGPRFAEQLGNLVFLEALASEDSERGGRAGFNAAYLKELVVPSGDAQAWADLAQRYESAASKLRGSERQRAKERADACRQIEREIRSHQAHP